MGIVTLPETATYPWWVRCLLARQKRRLGRPLEPMRYWGRTPRVFFGFLWMFAAFKRKRSPIGKTAQALVRLHISQLLHCPFCIDMNASEAHQLGLSPDKLEELSRYKESPQYTEEERTLLEYAEAVVQSESQRIVELQRRLKTKFSDDAIIELTALIGHQAMSAMFNSALQIPPHGFCRVSQKDSATAE